MRTHWNPGPCQAAALLFLLAAATCPAAGEVKVLDPGFHHLRNLEPREWDHFPDLAENKQLEVTFDLPNSQTFKTLTFRQADVKQTWEVHLNDKKIGQLDQDDNDLEHSLPLPPGLLKKAQNRLTIGTRSDKPDDIRLGRLCLHPSPRKEMCREATLSISVRDPSGQPLPCRLTIVDAGTNHLVLLGAASSDRLAVRAGVIYSLDGMAETGVRPGTYKIHAGRGFEYSHAETTVQIAAGARREISLTLQREVDTSGLVACDPHLHTGEFARHGDATLTERLITIAGEGIELPISTEHDQHIDFAPEARRIGADRFFTPVIGCEVTTKLGHFNSFPIESGAPPAQHQLRPWPRIFRNIFATPGVKVVILNHPRDLHAGFRPLDPAHFDATRGRFSDGRLLRANGMEVINSGAQQSDPMQLVHDWMALLRGGHAIAAIGSSDSHTVNFAIAGQARTYLPCPDNDPGNLPVDQAVTSFLKGNTHVSFGLLTTLKKSGPDEVTATVAGPGWTIAKRLILFADGKPVRTVSIPKAEGNRPGIKANRTWTLKALTAGTKPTLVAVAKGPGISEPWWRMMPPYQADRPEYRPYVMGISPALR